MFQTPVLAPPTSSSGSSGGKPASAASAGVAPVVFPCLGSYSPNSRQQVVQSTAAAHLSSAGLGSKLHSSAASSSALVPGLPLAATAPAPGLGQFPASGCCPVQGRKSLSPPGPGLPGYAGMQMQTEAAAPASVSGLGTAAAAAAFPLSHSPGIMQVSPASGPTRPAAIDARPSL